MKLTTEEAKDLNRIISGVHSDNLTDAIAALNHVVQNRIRQRKNSVIANHFNKNKIVGS